MSSASDSALTVDALWQLDRLSGVAVSPDGSRAVCTVTSYDMAENCGRASLWLLSTLGGAPRRLTACGERDGQPAWSPDGSRIAFVAKRSQEGESDATPQLYVMDADGGEARRVSHFKPGVEAFRWTADGRGLIFVAWLWPELRGAAAQGRRWQQEADRKFTGYATQEVLYRHWDRNLPQGRVPHLCLLELATGRVRDLFEGTAWELPRTDPGLQHFDLSPDGRHLAFVHDPAPVKSPAHRACLYEMDLKTRRVRALGQAAPWDFSGPRYSPDSRRLAVVAARTGEHHTAFGELAVFDRAAGFCGVTVRSPLDVQTGLRWSPQGDAVFFTAEERGRCPLWRHDLATAHTTVVVPGGTVMAFDVPSQEDLQVVLADSALHPPQVHAHRPKAAPRRLETFNDEALASIRLGKVEEQEVVGGLGDRVLMWLVFPPGFNPRRKHPVFQMIHGGPYAASGDSFSWRWNPHVLASRGHVVAMVNFHGSSGFGWPFRQAIVGRTGELELQDIEAGTDWLLRQPWVDAQRVHAGGGSYGGFLAAWMNGHVPSGRYRSYVCHAGVFDRVATWSADSYTLRHLDLGAQYWEDLPRVQSQSPATYAGAMRTPTLITHGAQDFRVPDHNGLAYYNTLKARGADARLLWFPDENHWILKPQNSRQWYGEVLEWLERT
jgi:dipeptidyl aminopeptidase/acylaminoacyl peptidase